jgi:serine/threonine-protein kinase HipA
MKGAVYQNGILAGYLEKIQDTGSYVFCYTDTYFRDAAMPPVSLSLPKSRQQYESKELFAFFQGLLSEGINKEIQCRLLKIDQDDDFTRLLKTAGEDTIGAVTVKPTEP